ncbi:MAG: hypothetical protein AMXMBFR13_41670 [Phycisphaerae bacterium]
MLEAVLSLFLMIVMLSGVWTFYMTSLRAREEGQKISREAILNRAILDRIAEEIRHASEMVFDKGEGFQGTRDRLTIVRVDVTGPGSYQVYQETSDERRNLQIDFRRITYQLYKDPEEQPDPEYPDLPMIWGLIRTEQDEFDPNSRFTDLTDEENPDAQPEALANRPRPKPWEMLAPEIKYLRFRFYDGATWKDRWQEGSGEGGKNILPQAVEITIGTHRDPDEEREELDITQLQEMEDRRENEEYHPDRFRIIVALRQADQSLLSSRQQGLSESLGEGLVPEGAMGEQPGGEAPRMP